MCVCVCVCVCMCVCVCVCVTNVDSRVLVGDREVSPQSTVALGNRLFN